MTGKQQNLRPETAKLSKTRNTIDTQSQLIKKDGTMLSSSASASNTTFVVETALKPLANIITRMQKGGNKLTSDLIACKALAKLHSVEGSTGLLSSKKSLPTGLSKATRQTGAQRSLPTALKKCLPYIEVKAEFKGGTTVRIPKAIDTNRQESLVVRWVVESARDRSTRAGTPLSFIDKLSKEYQDIVASNQTCGTYKKLLDLHRTALANRGQLR